MRDVEAQMDVVATERRRRESLERDRVRDIKQQRAEYDKLVSDDEKRQARFLRQHNEVVRQAAVAMQSDLANMHTFGSGLLESVKAELLSFSPAPPTVGPAVEPISEKSVMTILDRLTYVQVSQQRMAERDSMERSRERSGAPESMDLSIIDHVGTPPLTSTPGPSDRPSGPSDRPSGSRNVQVSAGLLPSVPEEQPSLPDLLGGDIEGSEVDPEKEDQLLQDSMASDEEVDKE
jgi:hypothetical protein